MGVTEDQYDAIPSHAHHETSSKNLLAAVEVLAVDKGKPTKVAVSHKGAQHTTTSAAGRIATPAEAVIFTKKTDGWAVLDATKAEVFPNGMIADQLTLFLEDESFLLGLLPKDGDVKSWSLSEKARTSVLERAMGKIPPSLNMIEMTAEWVESESVTRLLILGRYEFSGDVLEGMPYTTHEYLSWSYVFQTASFRFVRQRLARKQFFFSTPGACDCGDPELGAVLQAGIYHSVSGNGLHTIHAGMADLSQSKKQPLFGADVAMAQAFSNHLQTAHAPGLSTIADALKSEGMSTNDEVTKQLASVETQQRTMLNIWKRVLATQCFSDVYAWLEQPVIKGTHAKLFAVSRNEEAVTTEMQSLASALQNDSTLLYNLSQWAKSLTENYWYQDLFIDGQMHLYEGLLQGASISGEPVGIEEYEADLREALLPETANLFNGYGMFIAFNKTEAERDHLMQQLLQPEAMAWLHLQKFVGRMAVLEIASSVTSAAKPAP